MTLHVAVFSCPLPALAHPTFSVVATLVRRGYRVTYVTSERFATEAAALGAEILRGPRLDSPFNQDDSDVMPIEQQYVRSLSDLAARTYTRLLPFYERNRPDLILYDLVAFAGVMIADKVGAPAIRISNQFDFTPATLESELLSAQVREAVQESERGANALLALHGSRRRNIVLEGRDPTAYFYMSELQLTETPRTSNVFYAPRCIAERPNVPVWKRTTLGDRPVALLASSTTYKQDPQYYKRCVVALSALGWETILVAGPSMLGEFESLPARCYPIQNISLFAVMPHVDLLISGAGMATAMEAVYHGLPMLMLSSGHTELEAYGSMYQSRGLGVHLKQPDADPENVAHRAMRMYNDTELRASVKGMQVALKSSAGAEELVNWFERRLDRT